MNGTPLAVPFDEPAERAVVGVVVGNPFAVEAAASIVAVDDFYHPAYARLFGAAVGIAGAQVHPSSAERVSAGWDRARRVAETARGADASSLFVDVLVAEAPVLWGVEPYARRVVEAARA